MYVILNDGGAVDPKSSSSDAQRILLQRAAIFELMSQGLACSLLFGLEFRDSKVSLSFSMHLIRYENRF